MDEKQFADLVEKLSTVEVKFATLNLRDRVQVIRLDRLVSVTVDRKLSALENRHRHEYTYLVKIWLLGPFEVVCDGQTEDSARGILNALGFWNVKLPGES